MLYLVLLHPIVALTWWQWSIHPSTVIGIAALAAIYVWAGKALHQRTSIAERSFFFSGLAVMFASLNGPIHDLSDDYLFSAHMVQHLVLTLAVPPLLIAGIPGWMLRPLLARRRIAPGVRFFTRAPIVAYPGQMLYSFLMSIPMSIIAVYIAMSDHVLYPAYASAPRVLPISPLEDQLLGALIMWIPGGIIFYIIMTVVFFKWNARGEDSTAGAQVDWKPSAA